MPPKKMVKRSKKHLPGFFASSGWLRMLQIVVAVLPCLAFVIRTSFAVPGPALFWRLVGVGFTTFACDGDVGSLVGTSYTGSHECRKDEYR